MTVTSHDFTHCGAELRLAVHQPSWLDTLTMLGPLLRLIIIALVFKKAALPTSVDKLGGKHFYNNLRPRERS
jgi:hypothetical protein